MAKSSPPSSKKASGNKSPSSAPLSKSSAAKPVSVATPDPNEVLKTLGIRLGLPLLGVWLFAIWMNTIWVYVLAGVLTAVAAGIVIWGWRRVQASRKVLGILQDAQLDTKEGRKAAIEKLAENKDGDIAATFAKAQLMMQDDPEGAQKTLESIDLSKLMPTEADQARSQRAMIHLAKGEVDEARKLVDGIELSRHEEAKTRGMLASVVSEAWARTGQAKKAVETLELYNPDDPANAEVRPQLWRARAFAYASLNNRKEMKYALKKLASENPQYLAGFLMKKVHPLLQKDASDILRESGFAPQPKMQFRRG